MEEGGYTLNEAMLNEFLQSQPFGDRVAGLTEAARTMSAGGYIYPIYIRI